MTDTPLLPDASVEPETRTILQRISVPFLSFSGVLFLTLLLSHLFVLPIMTTFTVGDKEVTVDDVIAYEKSLRADVLQLETKRSELVLPHIDDTLTQIQEEKRTMPTLAEVEELIVSAMRGTVEPHGAVVEIAAMQIDGATHTVTVRGNVSGETPNTIALLAAAIDAVRGLRNVSDLTVSPYTREDMTDGFYRSPFTFSFTLP